MSYSIKEIFFTLQGEGANAGRPAVFCRFAGCNLWSGLERDRATAVCKFCDTDFVGIDGPGGGRFESARDLAQAIRSEWPEASTAKPFVVCTGGEPLLQLDEELVGELHSVGFEVAIETNGTREPPRGVDWICVSPKSTSEVVVRRGHELKLVYPQPDCLPAQFDGWEFENFFVQPLDDDRQQEHIRAAVEFCLHNPKWRLSLQTHKILEIP